MVAKPCYCMSTRTGAIIIGIVDCIFSILAMTGVVFKYNSITYINNIENSTLKEAFRKQLFHDHPGFDNKTEDLEQLLLFLNKFLIFLMGISIISLLMSSLLILGVRKERLSLMKGYLIFFASLLTLSFVSTSFNLNQYTGMTGYFYGFQLVMCFLHLYFLYVVCVLYADMWDRLFHGSVYGQRTSMHPTTARYRFTSCKT